MLTAFKIRIFPSAGQAEALTKAFGCARWLWNNCLAETQAVYKETGKGLSQFTLNSRLPELKKEHAWLAETHSQVLQAVSLNMSRAFINFLERRAKYPKFKSKHGKQSIQYPQGVKLKDWLHKLSRRLVDENQVIAVEDLNVKGMMANHCLSKAISDVGWSMLTSFIKYKASRAGKGFVKVNRFFPSSKICSCCMHAQASMPLNIRSWRCDKCGSLHDRDVNAAQNIRLEAQCMIAAGIAGTANRGAISQGKGRKSSVLARAVEVGSL